MKISQITLFLLLSAPIHFSLAKSKNHDQGLSKLSKEKLESGTTLDNTNECSPYIMYEFPVEGKPD